MPSTLLVRNYEQARDELARAVRTCRSDCSPHDLARELLEYDQPGHTALVGIDVDATKAVLYHERDRYVVAVRIGPDGLADGGPKIAGSDSWPGIDDWVENVAAYWGWLHPQFRWNGIG